MTDTSFSTDGLDLDPAISDEQDLSRIGLEPAKPLGAAPDGNEFSTEGLDLDGGGPPSVVLEDAVSRSPDEHLKNAATAKELGVPQRLVDEAPADEKDKLAAAQLRKFLEGNEFAQDWYSDPGNARLAHDDVDYLTGIIHGVKRAGLSIARGTTSALMVESQKLAEDADRSFLEILATVPSDTLAPEYPLVLADVISRYVASRGNKEVLSESALSMGLEAGELSERMAGLKMSDAAARAMRSAELADSVGDYLSVIIDDPLGTMALATEIGVEFAPQMAVAAGVTYLTKDPLKGAATMGVLSGGTEAQAGIIDFLQRQGVDMTDPTSLSAALENTALMNDATTFGYTRGMIIGAFDVASGGMASKAFGGPMRNFVTQAFLQAGMGGGGEAAAQLVTEGELSGTDIFLEAIGEFATSPIEVVGVGGQYVMDYRNTKRAEAFRAHVEDLLEKSRNSLLRNRSPEKFEEFFQSLSEDAGDTGVLVHLDPLIAALRDAGEDPLEFFQNLGLSNEEINSAFETGGDVRVPSEKFFPLMADHALRDEVLTHVREDEEAYTLAQAEERTAELQVQAQVLAEQSGAELSDELSQTAVSVGEYISEQAAKSGPYSAAGARSVGAMWEAMFRTVASDYAAEGKEFNVEAFFEALNLDIRKTPFAAREADPAVLSQAAAEYGISPEEYQQQLADADGDVTKTPAFVEWFEMSAVRDEAGAPIPVYHGTQSLSNFEEFDPQGSFGPMNHFGSWFSTNPGAAEMYAGLPSFERGVEGGSGPIIPAYLNITNPWIVEGSDGFDNLMRIVEARGSKSGHQLENHEAVDYMAVREYFKNSGYDGVVIKDFSGDAGVLQDIYIALDSAQVKSPFNQGTFDPTDPRILMQASEYGVTSERMAQELAAVGGDITQTEAFRAWFSGSKAIVDNLHSTTDTGRILRRSESDAEEIGADATQPLVLYHLTKGDFDTFIPGGPDFPTDLAPHEVSFDHSGEAIYLSPSPENIPAVHNAGREGNFVDGANVMPVYASVSRPLFMDTDTIEWAREIYGSQFPLLISEENRASLQEDGYDSIFLYGEMRPDGSRTDGDLAEVILLNRHDVKSVFNNGEFNPGDPRILMQKAKDISAGPDGRTDQFDRDLEYFRTNMKRFIETGDFGRRPYVVLRRNYIHAHLTGVKVPLTMTETVGRKLRHGRPHEKVHTDVPAAVIANLPALLADPVAVYRDSGNMQDRALYVLNAQTKAGEIIVVAVKDTGEIVTVTPQHHEAGRSSQQKVQAKIVQTLAKGQPLYLKSAEALSGVQGILEAVKEYAPAARGLQSRVQYRDDVIGSQGRILYQGEDGGPAVSGTGIARMFNPVSKAVAEMRLPAWKTQKGQNSEPKAKGSDIWQALKGVDLGVEVSKKEALKWTGIEELLTGDPDARFTREDLVAWLDQNGVELAETIAGDAVERDEHDDAEVSELTFTDERIWDDDEAWNWRVEDLVDDEEYIIAPVYETLLETFNAQIEADIGPAPSPNTLQFDLFMSPSDTFDHQNDAWIERAKAWLDDEDNAEEHDFDVANDIQEAAEASAKQEYEYDPYYIYDVSGLDGDENFYVFGNDDTGYSLREGDPLSYGNAVEGLDGIYSLDEMRIQATAHFADTGQLAYEGDDATGGEFTSTKWEGYVSGEHTNYREIKLRLPENAGPEFHNNVHFPDANIVAFIRATDRQLRDPAAPPMQDEFTDSLMDAELRVDKGAGTVHIVDSYTGSVLMDVSEVYADRITTSTSIMDDGNLQLIRDKLSTPGSHLGNGLIALGGGKVYLMEVPAEVQPSQLAQRVALRAARYDAAVLARESILSDKTGELIETLGQVLDAAVDIVGLDILDPLAVTVPIIRSATERGVNLNITELLDRTGAVRAGDHQVRLNQWDALRMLGVVIRRLGQPLAELQAGLEPGGQIPATRAQLEELRVKAAEITGVDALELTKLGERLQGAFLQQVVSAADPAAAYEDLVSAASAERRLLQSRANRTRVYAMDEFQSDWHQKGRQHGYFRGEDGVSEADLEVRANAHVVDAAVVLTEDLRGTADADAFVALRSLFTPASRHWTAEGDMDALIGTITHIVAGDEGSIAQLQDGKVGPFFKEATSIRKSNPGLEGVFAHIEAAADMYKQIKAMRDGVPDAPFSDDRWMSMGLKRALIDAVEGNYETFAWANGEALGQRWSHNYDDLYQTQYDKKMPAIVKRLTGQDPVMVDMDGVPIEVVAPPELIPADFGDDPLWAASVGSQGSHLSPTRPLAWLKLAEAIEAHVDENADVLVERVPARGNAEGYWGVRVSGLPNVMNTLHEGSPDVIIATINRDIQTTHDMHNDAVEGWWTIPITEELKQEILTDGFSLFQNESDPLGGVVGRDTAGAQVPLGSPDQSSIDIMLFENADMSTLLHESGHVFVNLLEQLAGRDDAPKRIVDNYQAMLDWVGAESAADLNPRAPGGVEKQEKLAEAFEVYLMEGKAPSAALQSAFQQFKQWLVTIYQRLVHRSLDVNVDDEIRTVFDRMLATDAEIAGMAEISGLSAGINPSITALMTEEERGAYTTLKTAAAETAAEATRLQEALLARRADTEAWQREYAKELVAAEEDLYARTDYRAFHFLTKGTMRGDEGTPPSMEGRRISRQAILDMGYTTSDLKALPKSTRVIYTDDADTATDPEHMAAYLGFAGGREMIEVMLGLQKPKAAIEQDAQTRMRAKHGNPQTDGTLTRLTEEALYNDEQARSIRMEMDVLAKKTGKQSVAKTLIKMTVDRIFDEQNVGDLLTPMKFQAASVRAARAAERAAAAGDFETAFIKKREHMLNHELFRRALAARDEVEKITTKLTGYQTRKLNPKTMDAAFIDQLKSLLRFYEFGAKSQTAMKADLSAKVMAFIKEREAAGEAVLLPGDLIELVSPITAENPDPVFIFKVKHWRAMSLTELRALRDVADNLAHRGRRASDAERAQRKAEQQIIADNIRLHAAARKDPNDTLAQPTRKQQKRDDRRGSFLAAHRKMESMLAELDGFEALGPMYKAVFTGLAEGQNIKTLMTQMIVGEFEQVMDTYSREERWSFGSEKSAVFIDALQSSMTREQRIALALNWGNVSSQEAVLEDRYMLEKYGEAVWNEDTVNSILATLDDRDLDAVERIWGMVNQFWNDFELPDGTQVKGIASLENVTTGVVPPKVEGDEITINGRVLAGGYYPLMYNDLTDARAARETEADLQARIQSGGFSRAHTSHGFTNARIGSGGRPVRLDLGVLMRHMDEISQDIAYREPVSSAAAILGSIPIQSAIRDTMGSKYLGALQEILMKTAGGNVAREDTWVNAEWMRVARLNMTTSIMGFNMRSVFTQPLGLFQTWARLGAVDTMRGIWSLYGNPTKSAQMIQEINAKSTYMAQRAGMLTRELDDIVNKMDTPNFSDKAREMGFRPMVWMDVVAVAYPTWQAAYEKAMRGTVNGIGEADEAGAVEFANMTVRTTQGSGGAQNLSMIQQSNELSKLVTMFYGYFNTTMNMQTEAYAKARQDGASKAGAFVSRHFIGQTMLLSIFPAIVASLFLEAFPDEDELEDDPEIAWLKWTLMQLFNYGTGQFVGIRDMGSAITSTFDYSLTPIEAIPQGIDQTLTQLTSFPEWIEDGEVPGSFYKNLARTSGMALGVPGSNQMVRTTDYLIKLANDDLDNPPDNAAELVKQLLFTGDR